MHQRRYFSFEYACRRNGRKPAKEFIDSLTTKEQSRFHLLWERLAYNGEIKNKQKFKKLRGGSGIWEFRSGDYRLFCFLSGNKCVLTNGYRKDQNRMDPRLVDLAICIKDEHLERSR